MSKEKSPFSEVLEPFRRVINIKTYPPKCKPASPKVERNQSLIEGLVILVSESKRNKPRTDFDSSNKSTAPPSEAKKMKIDLIAAKAQTVKEHKEAQEAQCDKEKNEMHKQIADLKDKLIADLKDKQLKANVSSKDQLSEMKRDKDELQQEIATLKYERDKATGELNDLQTVRKKQESLIHQMQKRLLLISGARDNYRNQLSLILDCYEKELTVSDEKSAGSDTMLSLRESRHLEKLLQASSQMRKKTLDTLRAEVSKWREEAESARRDVEKMCAQRDAISSKCIDMYIT